MDRSDNIGNPSKVQTYDKSFAQNPSVALEALIRRNRRTGFVDTPVIQSDTETAIFLLIFNLWE